MRLCGTNLRRLTGRPGRLPEHFYECTHIESIYHSVTIKISIRAGRAKLVAKRTDIETVHDAIIVKVCITRIAIAITITVQLYGVTPPVAVSVWSAYTWPSIAGGRITASMTSGSGGRRHLPD